MRHKILSSLLCLSASLYAETKQEWCFGPRPMRATARHIEGKGIGYQDGYTSLDLFFSAPNLEGTSLSFLDLRGHVFDDGKLAFNAGVGFRHQALNRIWGVNAYYDNRFTNRHFFNQLGVGAECLGKRWDFRLNGYLPLGPTESKWYGAEFGEFEGNRLMIRRKQQIAMRGLDGEAAVHFNQVKSFNFDMGAGPYFFQGKDKQAYGGKLRAAARYKDYIWVELSGSYDTVFHGIVQGQIGFSVPFGPKMKIQQKSRRRVCCPEVSLLKTRLVQPIFRQEIIVIDKLHLMETAINPATGLPYNVVFVDNQSHSAGTFESPYPTFSQALAVTPPADIIYVFPGDGSTTGLNASTAFQLLDNQLVLGSATPQKIPTTLGMITIPPLADQMPHFAAATTVSILKVANNNTISGLHMTANGFIAPVSGTQVYCIGSDGTTITNLTVIDNLLEAQSGASDISFTIDSTVQGAVVISNNTFIVDLLNSTDQQGIGALINFGNATSQIENNFFMSTLPVDVYPQFGLVISSTGTSLDLTINKNTFDSIITAIDMGNELTFSDVTGSVRVTNNTFTSIYSSGITFRLQGGPHLFTLQIENNDFNHFVSAGGGADIEIFDTSTPTLTFSSNNFSSLPGQGLFLSINCQSASCQIESNTFENIEDTGITISSSATESVVCSVIGNQFSNAQQVDLIDIFGHGPGSLCLQFTDNTASPGGFTLIRSGGVFNIEPLLRNSPQPVIGTGFVTQGICH